MQGDYYSEAEALGYRFGQLSMGVVLLGLLVWVIVVVSRNNAKQRAFLSRDPRADLAVLSVTVTVHAGVDQALALVSGIAVASGRLVPVAGPAPAWRVDGGYPVVTLQPTAAGSVLAVRELVVPLPSPQGAILWDWVVTQVEHASARDGVRTSRSTQTFVPSRPLDPYSAIWSSVD